MARAKQTGEHIEQPDILGSRPTETPQPPAPAIRSATPESLADPNVPDARRDLERKRRTYVKRSGGFRKNLHPDDVKAGEAVCKEYGKPASEGWDRNVFIPDFDNVNHDVNRRKKVEVK